MPLLPSGEGREFRNIVSLLRCEVLGPSLSTPCATRAARRRMSLRFAHGVLSFAYGNVEYLLRKLDGIARTFSHETSMPQAAPCFYAMRFQTEALPPMSCDAHHRRAQELITKSVAWVEFLNDTGILNVRGIDDIHRLMNARVEHFSFRSNRRQTKFSKGIV